jgi:3-dehydroquinate dehydratase-2
MSMRILVLHGPNLNLFGRREPHIYGKMTLTEINAKLNALAAELGVELAILQSNHEGALIDFMQQHIDSADGAILNPGGLTQHGISTHDCIKAMPFPVIEVPPVEPGDARGMAPPLDHLPGGQGTVQGLGWRSYTAGAARNRGNRSRGEGLAHLRRDFLDLRSQLRVNGRIDRPVLDGSARRILAQEVAPLRSCAGRIGRGTNPPPQFGQTSCSTFSTHAAQNVHS